MREFTPHARGSTTKEGLRRIISPVYPACAGIDPTRPSSGIFGSSLPRMRGDRPHFLLLLLMVCRFTPHARGSTPGRTGELRHKNVYPACAGIDLATAPALCMLKSLPRMRGDRPERR